MTHISETEQYGPKTKAALESLERSKQALSRAALEGADADSLSRIVHEIARGEGYLRVQYEVEEIESYESDLDKRTEATRKTLLDGLLRGADDTWSGRGNDLKREIFDGYRTAAQRVLRGF